MLEKPHVLEVKLKTLEMKLKAFLKDLKYSKSPEREKDVEFIINGIDAFRNVSLANEEEEEEEDFMESKHDYKWLSQIIDELNSVIHSFNQNYKVLTKEVSNFLVSLQLCLRVVQDYYTDAFYQKRFLTYQ
jgi:chromosome segregation ATPase